MPVNVTRRPVNYQQLEIAEPVTGEAPLERGFWDNINDTYSIGWLGAVKNSVEQTFVRNATREIGFDGLDNVPMGYEDYAGAYAFAESPEEVATITQNIDETNGARQRLSANSIAANLGYGLVTGIFDPINLIGGPALKGAGFLAGAAKGGAVIGSINAGTEIVRHSLDPTSTIEETTINIGFGFLVAGLIGGGIGAVTKGGPGVTVSGTARLTPEQRARADAAGNKFSQALNAVEGVPVKEIMDFNNLGVRIVDAPTGKVDRNGNPINAFYRSKEAFEELERRAAVRKAADDALGDVIPDGDEAPIIDSRAFDDMGEGAGSTPTATEAAVPTGRTASEEAPRTGEDAAPRTEAEDTIFIDTVAIAKSFPNKPWANPRYEGITLFAEDAFKTPEEWVNFVALHELNHKTTKRIDGESVAEYENRINTMAYDEVRAGRLPMSPPRGVLEDLALLPTPQGSLNRYAPNDDAVHGLAQGIAGDHATQTIASQAGRAAQPGGSVFQRAMRWNAEYFKAYQAIREGYSKYVRGYAANSEFMLGVDNFTASLPIIGAARRQGKMTFDEFNMHVGRAVFDDGEFSIDGRMLDAEDMVTVREASGKVREVLSYVEAEAKNLGMFERQKVIEREIAWRETANARDELLLTKAGQKRGDEIRARLDARKTELDEFRAAADDLVEGDMRFRGDDSYWHRLYNIGVIRERYDDFVDLIAMGFAREAGEGAEISPDIRLRASQTADRIIGEGIEENAYGFPGVRALRTRVIPLSNKELADFILLDADTVMNTYIRRMGPAIEMHRAYGSRNLDKQLDELQSHLIENNYSPKMRQKITWEMEAMRDRVLGSFHAKDPTSWDNRVARAAKNYANLTVMGRGIYSQFVDVAKTVAVEGHGPLFKAIHASFSDGFKNVSRGRYAREAGEAFEFAQARAFARGMEQDSAIVVTNQTGIERGLAKLQAPFFAMNMMNPFTVIWKDFSSMMTAHRLIADSQTLAKALRSGKTLETLSKRESKISSELASWGIDARRAQLIADMPVEKSNGGLLLANLNAWEGTAGAAAREAFVGALSGNIRSNVVTPGPLQRAAIMDGVFRVKKGGAISRTFADGSDRLELPLLSLPFQLLSFATSASAKTTHGLLSGRDRNRYITLTGMLMGGYVSAWLAAGDNWENLTWEESFYNALDRSGILGWGLDPIKRVEALTDYGPRSAMGLEPYGEGEINPKVGAVAGPAAGVMAGVAEAFISDDMSDGRQASNIRRGIPLAGMVWWDETLKDWTRAAASNSGYGTDLDPLDVFEDEEETVEQELVTP
jgi:hypothetical protein